MTASQAQPSNKDGHPCPLWCTSNHDELTASHLGQQRDIHPGSDYNRICAAAIQEPSPLAPARRPHVALHGAEYHGRNAVVLIGLHDAEGLAVIVDMLGVATPSQHRELAAAIRKAAAEITEAGER